MFSPAFPIEASRLANFVEKAAIPSCRSCLLAAKKSRKKARQHLLQRFLRGQLVKAVFGYLAFKVSLTFGSGREGSSKLTTRYEDRLDLFRATVLGKIKWFP